MTMCVDWSSKVVSVALHSRTQLQGLIYAAFGTKRNRLKWFLRPRYFGDSFRMPQIVESSTIR